MTELKTDPEITLDEATAEMRQYVSGARTCPSWVDPVLAAAMKEVIGDPVVETAVKRHREHNPEKRIVPMIGTARDGAQLARSLALLDLCVRGWLPLWLGLAGCVQAREALRGASPLTPDVMAQGGGGLFFALDVARRQSRALDLGRSRIPQLGANPRRNPELFVDHPVGAACGSAWRTLMVLPEEIQSEEHPATATITRAVVSKAGPLALDIAVRCAAAAEHARRPGVADWQGVYDRYAEIAAPVIDSLPRVGLAG